MFKFLTDKEKIRRAERDLKQVAARQKGSEATLSIAFVTMAESGSIDDITASEHLEMFAPWASNVAYSANALREYDGALYRCVQAHTSQDDWTPDAVPALWTKVADPNEEYPAWSQPVGAHDAYAAADTVSHKDKKWTSVADGNVWEPGVYGWEEVA